MSHVTCSCTCAEWSCRTVQKEAFRGAGGYKLGGKSVFREVESTYKAVWTFGDAKPTGYNTAKS